MAAIIEVEHLKKYFDTPRGKLHAVDDVSFKIEQGTTMGVVGESGCGKSTLGRTIIHLQESTGGKIFFQGEDVTQVSGKKLHQLREDMQIIFQDPFSSLNPRMTIQETIREPLLLSGRFKKSEIEAETRRLMDQAGKIDRILGLERRLPVFHQRRHQLHPFTEQVAYRFRRPGNHLRLGAAVHAHQRVTQGLSR